MTSADRRVVLVVPLLALAAACGGGSSSSPAPGGPNVVPITVNGASCPATAYFNEPCVSVKVCVPGTSTCQTIDHLLLDTGSVGLRVFSQALTVQLPTVSSGGGTLAECVGFLDGSAQWGPVVRADVVLGGEPAVTIPIQRIDSTFSTPPQNCAGAQADPATAMFDGILGVQGFPQDCGDGCNDPRNPANGIYFSCSGSTCTSVATPVQDQLTNPVAALPLDNNGVVVSLPSVPATGARSVSGQLILGIGTRTNNQPSGVTAFPLDDTGQLRTAIGNAAQLHSFFDTGSNGIFFSDPPDPRLTRCTAQGLTDWFCPASPVTVTATNAGFAGTPTGTVQFQIASIASLPDTVAVSSAVGGIAPGAGVDYGLPFHFGRNVYLVMWGRSAGALGDGPAVAY